MTGASSGVGEEGSAAEPSVSAAASGERSIAAGRSIRQAISGDGSVGMYAETALALPAEAYVLPTAAPEGMVNLPDDTTLFVGRELELARLDEAFTESGGVVVQAVHGLGGIGKSTLAAHWAAGRVHSYNPVWWITAETPTDLEAGLADLAVALQPVLRDVLSREALRERAVQWLATHEGWLLVLDNVSDPAQVKPLLGRAPQGRFLITTRRASGWHGIAETLSLDVLPLPEAVRLFSRIRLAGPDDELGALCAELGCLPLAVEQAAAYCAEAGISAGRYRELLAAYPEELFAQSAEGTDRARTVARVWRVSLDRLAETPLAGRILGIIAWWAPDGIPRAYLDGLGSPIEITEALRRLAAHSLVKLHDDATISVHRLVQAVARAESGEGHTAAAMLERNSPRHRGIDQELMWIAHMEAMAGHADPSADTMDEAWLFSLGAHRYDRDKAQRAIELHERAVAATERAHGPDGWATLLMHRNLARSHGYAGDHEHAIDLLEENLADYVRTFGPDDRRSFDARTELAKEVMKAGRVADARALAEQNAERAEEVLGDEDRTTLEARAVWTDVLTELALEGESTLSAEVVCTIEDLMDKAARVEGEDSDIFDKLHRQLATAREAAGDIPGALALLEENIARRSRVYGETDWTTMLTRSTFVSFVWNQAADPDRARELAIVLVADWKRLLGDDPYVRQLQQDFAPLLDPPGV
ncbi:tetratricopeptide repeat protein [Streptomyces canus]|uniref:tetratricopeptide repeat protein n=1 Tax=Streptomyces canus TaxID=58343 RepID=UPI0037165CA0